MLDARGEACADPRSILGLFGDSVRAKLEASPEDHHCAVAPASPTASFAWNPTGHRVIASIAYRQLDDQTRRKIAGGPEETPRLCRPSGRTARPTAATRSRTSCGTPRSSRMMPAALPGTSSIAPRNITSITASWGNQGNKVQPALAGGERGRLLRDPPTSNPRPADPDRGKSPAHFLDLAPGRVTFTSRSTPSPGFPGRCRKGIEAATTFRCRTRGRSEWSNNLQRRLGRPARQRRRP